MQWQLVQLVRLSEALPATYSDGEPCQLMPLRQWQPMHLSEAILALAVMNFVHLPMDGMLQRCLTSTPHRHALLHMTAMTAQTSSGPGAKPLTELRCSSPQLLHLPTTPTATLQLKQV